jgi:hypothetical protein
MALIRWGSVTDINFWGIKITLNWTDTLILIPIVISIIYCLINYQLLKIAKLYDLIYR